MTFRKLMRFTVLIALSGVSLAAFADSIPAHDIPGGHDSSMVSRFPGSIIIGYHTIDFDQATLPMGVKLSDDQTRLLQTETVSGKVTDLAYAGPVGKSAFEVYHNYQAALVGAGFVTQFHCDNATCGDRNGADLSTNIATTDLMERMGKAPVADYYNLMIDVLSCNGGQLHVSTSRLTRPQGNVDVSLMVCGADSEPVGVLLQIVEEKPMATGEVSVNAKAMSHGLTQNGHIALYGIHFATDSAALTPDSNATLTQMVDLLQSQPRLKVYIVGHTDNTGTLSHNLKLSQQRANSVMKALEQHGIAASRLAAKGLASYAPVASNGTEAGRAKNRRVELVEQ